MTRTILPTLLICGIPKDYHAEAVRWGLATFGIESRLWVGADLPDFAQLSVSFEEQGAAVRLHDGHGTVRLDDVQLVWNRRNQLPQAPEFAAAVDASFIEAECREHVLGARHLLSQRVRTINSLSAQRVAARKTVQIEHARRVGFAVPTTLISNHPETIRAFWEWHAPLVVKPFRTTAWSNDGTIFAAFTAVMPEPLPEHEAELELCPQIFQALVPDKRDVRVIAFDGQCFAAELDDSDHRSIVDVRDAIRSRTIRYHPIDVPQIIQQRIMAYLRGLELEYGAFDFAIDAAGEWVFLECNEAGQFLFLEVALPDLTILDSFCRWFCKLMGVDTAPAAEPLRLSDFEASAHWTEIKSQVNDGHKHFVPEENAYRREGQG
ncbi:MAG TPA: hypothetical protein VEZ70_02605 [Allosphingosinicella sp.]|nr:hypothetical protein [Allosphingosinicella sp.]